MSGSAQLEQQSADGGQAGAGKASGVVLTLAGISGVLALVPGTRTVGLAFLVLLAVPAVAVWGRARRRTDGGRRGLPTAALILGAGVLISGCAAGAGAAKPLATTIPASTPATTVTPTTTATATTAAAPAAVIPPAPAAPAPRPAPAAAPVPRAAPAPAPKPAPKPPGPPAGGGGAYYKNCDAARAAGAAPLYAGQPGYRAGLDRDGDGVACE